jgi:hypothetical protein
MRTVYSGSAGFSVELAVSMSGGTTIISQSSQENAMQIMAIGSAALGAVALVLEARAGRP